MGSNPSLGTMTDNEKALLAAAIVGYRAHTKHHFFTPNDYAKAILSDIEELTKIDYTMADLAEVATLARLLEQRDVSA